MKQHSLITLSINSLKALLALSVIFISSPSFAQSSEPNHIHTKKSATYNYGTGEGLITIESYVDGEITKKPFGKASDVVLVLDVSNSMCPTNPNDQGVESLGESVFLFNGDKTQYLHLGTSATDNNTTTHDYKTETTIGGKKYLRYTVQLGGTGTMYNLAYFVNNTSYKNTTTTTSTKWTGTTGWYYGTSTAVKQGGTTSNPTWKPYTPDAADMIYTDVKLDILENACRNLIEVIYANPFEGTGTGHRISIVTWADNNDGNASIHYINRGLTETTAANKSALIGDVTFLETGPNTYAKRGLDKAYTNLSSSSSDREKIVLFFTDGEPNNKFADIVNSAKNLKDAGAKVFSVALVDKETKLANRWNTSTSKDIEISIKTYLEYVSSLYPEATGELDKTGKTSTITKGDMNDDGVEYYHWSKTGSDLADVFKSIGGMAFTGGAGKEDLDASDGVHMVDKINMENCVLVDADSSKIKTYTAVCTGKDANDSLTFADPVLVDSLTVRVYASADPQYVDVLGFNYSENWCGPDESAGDDVYHGQKLIVTIPFKMRAPGDGTFDLAKTNAAGSSLYRGDEPVEGAGFPIPEIPFTEVTIQKYGLKAGDSAVYIIKKAGVEITRVVLTGTDDSGSMVSTKLRILEPGVEYSVTETWWDYTYTKTSSDVDVTNNVFVFNSEKKSGMENEAEHRKVNDFYKK